MKTKKRNQKRYKSKDSTGKTNQPQKAEKTCVYIWLAYVAGIPM